MELSCLEKQILGSPDLPDVRRGGGGGGGRVGVQGS